MTSPYYCHCEGSEGARGNLALREREKRIATASPRAKPRIDDKGKGDEG